VSLAGVLLYSAGDARHQGRAGPDRLPPRRPSLHGRTAATANIDGPRPWLAGARTLLGMDISTASGPARAEVDAAPAGQGASGGPEFLLVLTHGAGGGVASKDLLAAGRGGLAAGAVVARVLQPYRVRGARAPGSPERQNAAWLEVIGNLRARYPGLPLVQGGRSNGARLACRTAQAAGALAVVALAFPLHPPGKASDPGRSRAGELRAAAVPVLVINGERDPFGIPDPADADTLIVLPGETHALSRHPEVIAAATTSWLRGVLNGAARLGLSESAAD